MLQTYTQINGTLVPQLLFKVKAKSQGYFLTAMPNVLHKTNSLPADLAVLKFKTSILSALQLHKCFVQPNWIQWFIWVLQGCNNLLCLHVAQHEGIQISSKPSSPTTTGAFSQYLNRLFKSTDISSKESILSDISYVQSLRKKVPAFAVFLTN